LACIGGIGYIRSLASDGLMLRTWCHMIIVYMKYVNQITTRINVFIQFFYVCLFFLVLN